MRRILRFENFGNYTGNVRDHMRIQGLSVEGGIAGGYSQRPKHVILEDEEESEHTYILYHGTPYDFKSFSLGKFGQSDSGWLGKGVYFTNDYEYAKSYGNVITAKVKVKNPYILTDYKYQTQPLRLNNELETYNSSDTTKKLQQMGYDSVILKYEDTVYDIDENPQDTFIEICVFDPENIEILDKEVSESIENSRDILMFESFKSQKEIEDLANMILQVCGDKTYKLTKEYKDYVEKSGQDKDRFVIDISTVYFKDVKKRDTSMFKEINKFLTEQDLYIQFSKDNKYTTTKGSYSKTMFGQTEIEIIYTERFLDELNNKFNKGHIQNGGDIYFQLYYEVYSTLLHELQHAYDDWRSKGKALHQSTAFNYNAKKRVYLMKKYKAGKELRDDELKFLEDHNINYYNLPHEIDARFTQAVNTIRPLKLNYKEKKWEMGMTWQEYIGNFKYEFPKYNELSDKDKKRILRKLGQFYEMEKDLAEVKTQELRANKEK